MKASVREIAFELVCVGVRVCVCVIKCACGCVSKSVCE